MTLVAAVVACGRSPLEGSAAAPGDASTLDAAREANEPFVDAGVLDASAGADQGVPPDSALDGSPSRDATDTADAAAEAATTDAGDAMDVGAADDASDTGHARDAGDSGDATDDASEAGPPHSTCDHCVRGDQQCGDLPPVCTDDDGGVLHCGLPARSIWTCVVGDAGCAVWDESLACRPEVPCCVPCAHEYNCSAGSLGDPCQQDTDCAFDACDAVTHVCISSPCDDHRQDGEETDVDCGGPLCGACLVGQRCQVSFDCQSGHACGPSHVCE